MWWVLHMKILNIAVILLLSGAVAGTSYVQGNGQTIAKINDTGIYYYHSDHLGSTSVVTNEEGEVMEEQKNLPFGELISGGEKYGFTGKEFEPDLNLNYFGARYYSPETGRFITFDPLGQQYLYGNNNPLRYVDPDGNKAKENRALEIAIRGGAKLIKWNKKLMKVPVIGSVVKKVNITYTGFYAGESICLALKAAGAAGNPNIEAAPTIMDDFLKPVGAATKVLAKRAINYFSPINLFGANEAYASEGGGSGGGPNNFMGMKVDPVQKVVIADIGNIIYGHDRGECIKCTSHVIRYLLDVKKNYNGEKINGKKAKFGKIELRVYEIHKRGRTPIIQRTVIFKLNGKKFFVEGDRYISEDENFVYEGENKPGRNGIYKEKNRPRVYKKSHFESYTVPED